MKSFVTEVTVNKYTYMQFPLPAPGHKKVQTDFSIDNINIKPEKSVKLLGIELDDKLKFDIQVSSMCKKAAKQLNVL